MNGPEHYRLAEECMQAAKALVEQGKNAPRMTMADRADFSTALLGTLQAAQVHATLALAAATATKAIRRIADTAEYEEDGNAWKNVLGNGS